MPLLKAGAEIGVERLEVRPISFPGHAAVRRRMSPSRRRQDVPSYRVTHEEMHSTRGNLQALAKDKGLTGSHFTATGAFREATLGFLAEVRLRSPDASLAS